MSKEEYTGADGHYVILGGGKVDGRGSGYGMPGIRKR